MTKTPKRPKDINQLAKMMIDIGSGEHPVSEETGFVKRARAGGNVGGSARALKLTPAQRAEIAREAALARWKKGD